MKKSNYIAIIAVLAAVAGALATIALFLSRRQKELEEYEQLLFSEEFNEEFDEEATEELASLEPDTEMPATEQSEL